MIMIKIIIKIMMMILIMIIVITMIIMIIKIIIFFLIFLLIIKMGRRMMVSMIRIRMIFFDDFEDDNDHVKNNDFNV